MKKISKLLFVLIILISLCACRDRRGKEPNDGRGTDYKYDFINYLDITTYGQDGDGYIEITTKEISIDNFDNEADYIAVKRDLESFNFNFIQGNRDPQNFTISKTSGLSNGEVVTITPKQSMEIRSDMNIEAYDYVVEGLGESKNIDLFSSDLVLFYALNDGTYGVYVKNNPSYDECLRDNLVYKITTKDKPIPGQAVLSVTVDLDSDFLKKEGCNDITIYLAKHNLSAELETEKVLNLLIEPIDVTASNSITIESALYKGIMKVEENLLKICNLQQLERQRATEPYTYIVVYSISRNGVVEYRRRDIKLININDEYQVIEVGSSSIVTDTYTTQAFEGGNMLIDYMIAEPVEVVETEENIAE